MRITIWILIHLMTDVIMVNTIQMTIDHGLLDQLDQAVKTLETTRSAFIRDALVQALHQYKIKQLELQDAAGFANIPAFLVEIDDWKNEQVWGDEWNAEKSTLSDL